jgi:hypothetical protein
MKRRRPRESRARHVRAEPPTKTPCALAQSPDKAHVQPDRKRATHRFELKAVEWDEHRRFDGDLALNRPSGTAQGVHRFRRHEDVVHDLIESRNADSFCSVLTPGCGPMLRFQSFRRHDLSAVGPQSVGTLSLRSVTELRSCGPLHRAPRHWLSPAPTTMKPSSPNKRRGPPFVCGEARRHGSPVTHEWDGPRVHVSCHAV